MQVEGLRFEYRDEQRIMFVASCTTRSNNALFAF